VTTALVPVKRLAATKSRLFGDRDGAAREALAIAMLRDVIAALLAARSVARVVVTTPDADVGAIARGCGAEALVRDDPGLNAALDAAARALDLGSEPLLVVLGDVAGALPEDLDALSAALDELGGRGAVLAPASDGGTTALLRAPHDLLPSRFGKDSAKRHREAASLHGVPFRELPLPSLALDLDVPEDVERFLTTSLGGEETRRVLADFGAKSGTRGST